MSKTEPELRSLLAAGRPIDVLHNLDAGSGPKDVFLRTLLIFDAHWDSGDAAQAIAALRQLRELRPVDVRTAERSARVFELTGSGEWDPRNLLPLLGASSDHQETNRIAGLLMALNQRGACEEFLRSSQDIAPLSPQNALRLARIAYINGDFDESAALARPLIATAMEPGAERHLRMVAFARGDFAQVLKSKAPPRTDFDHLRFNALLATDQIASAFAMLPFPGQLALLEADFPEKAAPVARKSAGRIGVISESGPGDQLVGATLLGKVAVLAESVAMTVDARLISLLSRSYPSVQFVESAPIQGAPFGSFRPGHQRLAGGMGRLLTDAAGQFLRDQCDQVVLARSLMSLVDPPTHQPANAPLIPLSELVEQVRPIAAGKIGICWRSELRTPWRSVHYFEVGDLAPLQKLDGCFVCLQHDVTTEERAELTQLFGDRIEFISKIALRDDFEGTAALLSQLDAVVGPGTTMTVLSAAVGTTTYVAHPTQFGAWLAKRKCGFWFTHRHHIMVTPPAGSKYELLSQVAEVLRSKP